MVLNSRNSNNGVFTLTLGQVQATQGLGHGSVFPARSACLAVSVLVVSLHVCAYADNGVSPNGELMSSCLVFFCCFIYMYLCIYINMQT